MFCKATHGRDEVYQRVPPRWSHISHILNARSQLIDAVSKDEFWYGLQDREESQRCTFDREREGRLGGVLKDPSEPESANSYRLFGRNTRRSGAGTLLAKAFRYILPVSSEENKLKPAQECCIDEWQFTRFHS